MLLLKQLVVLLWSDLPHLAEHSHLPQKILGNIVHLRGFNLWLFFRNLRCFRHCRNARSCRKSYSGPCECRASLIYRFRCRFIVRLFRFHRSFLVNLAPVEDDLVQRNVLDPQPCDSAILVPDPDYLEPVVALAVLGEFVVTLLDPDERCCVQFPADAPVEAGPLEAVGGKALFPLGVALRAGVFLADPLFHLFAPNGNDAVLVVPGMFPLPAERPYHFVKDVLIAPRILIQEQG